MTLNLTELFQNTRKLSNVSIICADGRVDTHKIVVASASQFLKQLMTPIPTGDEITIFLPDYNKDQVEQMLLSMNSANKSDVFASPSSTIKPEEVRSIDPSFYLECFFASCCILES